MFNKGLCPVIVASKPLLNAVDCVENGELFHFHENPSIKCPVGKNIHNVLDEKLYRVQTAMENEMKKITLADVINDLQILINKKN